MAALSVLRREARAAMRGLGRRMVVCEAEADAWRAAVVESWRGTGVEASMTRVVRALRLCQRPNKGGWLSVHSWSQLAEYARVSRATLARRLRELLSEGWLVQVERGRGCDLTAPTYALVGPKLSTASPETPSKETLRVTVDPLPRASAEARKRVDQPLWQRNKPATTGAERLQLVRQLGRVSSVFADCGERWLRWRLRPLLDLGATMADVLSAIDRTPDGEMHTYTWRPCDIRDARGWVSHRLRAWVAPQGLEVMSDRVSGRRRAAAEAFARREASARRVREAAERRAAAEESRAEMMPRITALLSAARVEAAERRAAAEAFARREASARRVREAAERRAAAEAFARRVRNGWAALPRRGSTVLSESARERLALSLA